MMRAWRIATDTATYTADDMRGEGARITGGRWNPIGSPVLYCAGNTALACLETLVHLGGSGLPLNRYLVAIDIPDAVWKLRESHTASTLAVGWDALPVGMVSVQIGQAWLASAKSAVLTVPSVIAPEDEVVLINPLHPDARKIKATKIRKWLYDSRIQPTLTGKPIPAKRKPSRPDQA